VAPRASRPSGDRPMGCAATHFALAHASVSYKRKRVNLCGRAGRQGPPGGDACMDTPFARPSPFALQGLEAMHGVDSPVGWGSPGGASPPGSLGYEGGPWGGGGGGGGGGSLYGSPQRRRSSPAPALAGGYAGDHGGGGGWAAARSISGALGDESTLELRREMLHARCGARFRSPPCKCSPAMVHGATYAYAHWIPQAALWSLGQLCGLACHAASPQQCIPRTCCTQSSSLLYC